MIPAEWCLVNLCEGHAPPLVRIGNVSLCMSVVVLKLLVAVRTYTPGTSRYAAFPTRPKDSIENNGISYLPKRCVEWMMVPLKEGRNDQELCQRRSARCKDDNRVIGGAEIESRKQW
jgi:hypothetical protein